MTKQKTLVEQVQHDIEKATGGALGFIKELAKGVQSSKIAAAVAGAIYIGDKGWKAKKGETLVKALAGLDIKTERHAKNYYSAGRVIIEGQLTEAEVAKIGLGKLQDFGSRLLEDESTGGLKAIQAKIAEYEALRVAKKKEKAEKAAIAKADKASRTKETAELLNQAFDEEDGLTPERVHAHLSVFFGDNWVDWQLVIAKENPYEFCKALNANIVTQAKAIRKAVKDEEKEKTAEAKKKTA